MCAPTPKVTRHGAVVERAQCITKREYEARYAVEFFQYLA